MERAASRQSRSLEVVDLETGNIGSVLKMLVRIGGAPIVVRGPAEISGSVPVVLPGVGHFTRAAKSLDSSGVRDRLMQLHNSGMPILGICLGAQLMARRSEEGSGEGLGWLATDIRRFPDVGSDGARLRVPHMAWQPFCPPPEVLPFAVPPGRMYFAHSYFIDPGPIPGQSLCESEFGGVRFCSVARSRNAIGAQFHPEKSHRFGMGFLSGWLEWAWTELQSR
jgi:glutamine amidotransferase